MKIFITGGSGFLGSQVIKRLAQQGHQILALARSESAAEKVRALGATAVSGDLAQSGWEEALKGVDVVIHAAALVEYWGPWERFLQVNVHAGQQLLEAAERAQVKRFIHVSSESVVMSGQDLMDIDESFPVPSKAVGLYAESKRLAEAAIVGHRGRIEKIVVRPSFIYGPGCPSYANIAHKLARGHFLWVDQGRAPFEAVHVENVAYALELALERGDDGDIFFITDQEKENTRDFFTRIIKAQGYALPKLSVPRGLALKLALVTEKICTALAIKNPPPLLPFEVDFVSLPREYKTKKISDKLGYIQLQKRQASAFSETKAARP